MTALQALLANAPDLSLAIGGLLIGALFGMTLAATNYCVMGAISDWHTSGNTGRLGAVALAAATAIIGAQVLDSAGIVDLSKSIYLNSRLNWLGALGGGLLFGFGMVYAGGCPSRALVRSSGGDMRALLVLLVLAIAAFATISGILGTTRVGIDKATALDVQQLGITNQSLTSVLTHAGAQHAAARLASIALLVVPLLYFAFRFSRVWEKPSNLFAGLLVGALVVAGWTLTSLAADEFQANPAQLSSLSFVRPVADAIDWIERSTALGLPGFGAMSVFGVLIGAFVTNWSRGLCHISGFADRPDLQRHMLGAVMMGVGGVMALGCSIGQGVSGISTLSLQSVLACSAIFSGAVLALKKLEREL